MSPAGELGEGCVLGPLLRGWSPGKARMMCTLQPRAPGSSRPAHTCRLGDAGRRHILSCPSCPDRVTADFTVQDGSGLYLKTGLGGVLAGFSPRFPVILYPQCNAGGRLLRVWEHPCGCHGNSPPTCVCVFTQWMLFHSSGFWLLLS